MSMTGRSRFAAAAPLIGATLFALAAAGAARCAPSPRAAASSTVAAPVRSAAFTAQGDPSTASSSSGDAVLTALREELNRSKNMRLGQFPAPYYISYSVTDVRSFVAQATLGAIISEQPSHTRVLRAVVRVGSYKQDSFFGRGTGIVNLIPIDNNVMAIRRQVWMVTDTAYKLALQSLTEKQSLLRQYVDAHPVDDFSKEPPLQALDPPVRIEADPVHWTQVIRDVSGMFRSDPNIQSSQALLNFRAANRTFINSEGSATQSGESTYSITLIGITQAPDGIQLARDTGFYVRRVQDLPPEQEVRASATRLITSLNDLRKAPVVADDYQGPVLFSPPAAASLMTKLVGANLEGRKPKLGEPSRVAGAYAFYYKSRVLPNFLTVVDDPTVQVFKGKALLGSYAFDDQAVKAQPVTAIDKGTLMNYLTDRTPLRDFPVSNGHGRATPGGPAVPYVSNLFVRPSVSSSFEQLKQKLIAICKNRGLPFGFLVTETAPNLNPRVLYRVYASDGHEELVRGAEFSDLDVRALRDDLIAAGDDAEAQNDSMPIPVSIVSPSLLFDNLEIKRANLTQTKLPDYPPPTISPKPATE
jgi:PmbA/TldA metallopeptidase C-terminal domain